MLTGFVDKSTTVITQKRRGPAPTGKGVLVGVRLQPDLLDALDRAATESTGRAEVIREALRRWLHDGGFLR